MKHAIAIHLLKWFIEHFIFFNSVYHFPLFFSPVHDAVGGGDAYTDGWEDSDCDEDGDVAAAAGDDEALDLPSIPESQDDQLLK